MFVDTGKATDSYLKFLILSLGSSDSYFDIKYKLAGKEFTMFPEKLVTDDPTVDTEAIEDAVQELNKAESPIEIEKVVSHPQKLMPGVEYYI